MLSAKRTSILRKIRFNLRSFKCSGVLKGAKRSSIVDPK
jgi:hypothetical protein